LSDLRFYAGHQSRFHYFGLKGVIFHGMRTLFKG